MIVDMVIKNGTIVRGSGRERAGIAIDKEKIVAIATELNLPEAKEVIDADGLFVLPGLIDGHSHLPLRWKGGDTWESASKAAALGGVTMVMNQPTLLQGPGGGVSKIEDFNRAVETMKKESYVDFNQHASPLGGADNVRKIAEAGTCNFKIFQKYTPTPEEEEAGTAIVLSEANTENMAIIYEAFKAVAEVGLSCSVHPHDNDLHNYLVQKWHEKEEKKYKPGFDKARAFLNYIYTWEQPYVMVSAAYRLKYLAQKAGMRWYALHCGHAGEDYIDLVRTAKAEGRNVIADTLCPYVFMMPEVDWPWNPSRERLEELIEVNVKALSDGTIDFIGTDYTPFTREQSIEVYKSEDPHDHGDPGRIDHWTPQLLTLVNKGIFPSLEFLVKIASENTAKCFNMYPRKGAIQLGSDADFTIVDMDKKAIISEESAPADKGKWPLYSKTGWTQSFGMEVHGLPVYTIVRGTIVMRETEIIGKPGHGKLVKPKLPMPGYDL